VHSTNFSGQFVAEASSVMLIEEVLEAIMCGVEPRHPLHGKQPLCGAKASSSRKTASLSSTFSGTASMTRSALETAPFKFVVGCMRARVSLNSISGFVPCLETSASCFGCSSRFRGSVAPHPASKPRTCRIDRHLRYAMSHKPSAQKRYCFNF